MTEDKKNQITETTEENEPKKEVSLMDILNNPEALKSIETLIVNIMNNGHKSSKALLIYKGIGLLVIVGAVICLSIIDKMDPGIGVLLGTLAGYLFGKEKE